MIDIPFSPEVFWHQMLRIGGWISVKNIKKVTVAVFALMFVLSFSSLAFSQTVFSVVKVPAMSPNSLTAINNAGQVVINTGTSDSYQVSTWNRINGTDNLGAIGVNSGGAAINLSGDVVGAGDPNNSGNLQAFIWHPTGGLTLLGTLGGALSAASGVNDSAGVVGLSYTATNTQHAFLWTQSGGMQDLTPDLTSIGGAAAVAINSSNQVVGYYFPNGSLNTLGFSWTQAGGLQSVGSAGTLAFAVNNAGTIVGKAPAANGYMHAFSKTATGSMKDLGTLGRWNIAHDFDERAAARILVEARRGHAGLHRRSRSVHWPATVLSADKRCRSNCAYDQQRRISTGSENDRDVHLFAKSVQAGTAGDFHGHPDLDCRGSARWGDGAISGQRQSSRVRTAGGRRCPVHDVGRPERFTCCCGKLPGRRQLSSCEVRGDHASSQSVDCFPCGDAACRVSTSNPRVI
jgi:probable HAF family extracellular repeat protein